MVQDADAVPGDELQRVDWPGFMRRVLRLGPTEPPAGSAGMSAHSQTASQDEPLEEIEEIEHEPTSVPNASAAPPSKAKAADAADMEVEAEGSPAVAAAEVEAEAAEANFEKWRSIFDRFDKQKRGFIGPAELKRGFRKYLKLELSNAEALRFFDRADKDQDGRIQYAEFVTIVEKGTEHLAHGGSAENWVGASAEEEAVGTRHGGTAQLASTAGGAHSVREEPSLSGLAVSTESDPTAEAELIEKIGWLAAEVWSRCRSMSCRSMSRSVVAMSTLSFCSSFGGAMQISCLTFLHDSG
eukprot:SAG11_NODE_3965_length_2130_cov_2.007878_2_plen_298_part_00